MNVHVKGDLMAYNNIRTYKRPYEGNNKIKWDYLVSILKTDNEVKNFFSNFQSKDIVLIIVYNASLVQNADKEYKPLDDYLFDDLDNSMIYNKYITYDINKQAQTFSEMFNIKYNPYTIDNFKANSCFINLIVDTYHYEFEKRKSDGKRMYSALTYESLCDLLQIQNKNQDIGLSIRQSIKFFEKYHIGLQVINVFHHLLFCYKPEKINHHIKNSVLRILIHNNHCYKLDNDSHFKLRNTKQKYDDLVELDEIEQLTVSNKYNIRMQ